jgi:hypothetical protein
MPSAELILFPDSNHGSHFQFAERFNRYVTDFRRSLGRAARDRDIGQGDRPRGPRWVRAVPLPVVRS